jgi:hypothetical protein
VIIANTKMQNKIEIEKIDEEETYRKITTTHTFKINGKEVRVYEYAYNDEMSGDQEYDSEIDEKDREELTEEEDEIFGDEVYELMKAKVGKKLSINGWENNDIKK